MFISDSKGVIPMKWDQTFNAQNVLKISASIFIGDEEVEENKAGEVRLYVFDSIWTGHLYDAADSISGDTEILIRELLNLEENGEIGFERVGVIDRIYIDEKYRGGGIGSSVLVDIYTYLADVISCDVICLIAKPLEKDSQGSLNPVENDEENEKKLINWYTKLGFQQLGKKDNQFFVDARFINNPIDIIMRGHDK